jgi:hypothetical protein
VLIPADRKASGALDKAISAFLALVSGILSKTKRTLVEQFWIWRHLQYFALSDYPTYMFTQNFARSEERLSQVNPSHRSSACLLQLGGDSKCNKAAGGASQKNHTSNVGAQQTTLVGRGRAFGGLLISNTMVANAGPAVMVTGFAGVRINLAGTGACVIHERWLRKCEPDDKTPRSDAAGTGILLAGDQHGAMVSDAIVFSGKVGVNSTNGANRDL